MIRSNRIRVFIFMAGALFLLGLPERGSPLTADIRQPVVADRFYPADPQLLKRNIRQFLEQAVAPRSVRPTALVAPHAGYIYSGQICADAYRQAAGHDYDLIVVLGTNHTSAAFKRISVYTGQGYRTPLGVMPIDKHAVAELMATAGDCTFQPEVHRREHSVEVQIPFTQMLFPRAKLLAAVVGSPDIDVCTRFGEALAQVLRRRKALIVASTDWSHYPAYADAVQVDRRSLQSVTGMDPRAVQQTLRQQMAQGVPHLATCACGEAPLLTAMVAAKALGADQAGWISYANSGDVPIGDRSRVVGYAALALFADERPRDHWTPVGIPCGSATPIGALRPQHKKALLSLARQTLAAVLNSGTLPLARQLDPLLYRPQGAFVTLKQNGQLRGCIGHMRQDMPLAQVVAAMALKAAFSDPRFPPLRHDECPGIDIEISVISPLQRIEDTKTLRLGQDGVVLEKDDQRAVFLPQVAAEHGWDRETLLRQLCRKAGLAGQAWRGGARLYTFQATVFSEAEFQ